MLVVERGNIWPDVDGFATRLAMEGRSIASSKPPLPLRPALREDMDRSAAASASTGGGSGSISMESVSPSSKKARIDPPWRYFEVMYGARKKNSAKPGPRCDGVLAVQGSSYNLLGMDGKSISKGKFPGSKEIGANSMVEVYKFVIEILDEIPEERYLSGQIFSSGNDVPEKSDITVECPRDPPPRSVSHEEIRSYERKLVLNKPQVLYGATPVVVDPYIALKLRPHQKEGVKFMYECVMGMRSSTFTGCLLADEMGLGKTLQTIALIWTLLRQGPRGVSAVTRVAVICPSTLVRNWGREVRKWLGSERLKAMVIDCSKGAVEKITDFRNDGFCPLLITSYEILRRHKDMVATTNIQLLVCDEAHRLKSCKGNKTIAALASLNCEKRILLTGTPVQNNLSEFYALIDFANPNLLGSYSDFKNVYASPIEQSRDRNASIAQKELGSERSEALKQKTSFCLLRRTAEINKQYLPLKTEYAVFCRLHEVQNILYEIFVQSQFVRTMLNTTTEYIHVLSAIGALRRLSNHPALVQNDMKNVTSAEIKSQTLYKCAEALLDLSQSTASLRDVVKHDWTLSGKFVCLQHILRATIECQDRIVVASNFTQTLDLIESMCKYHSWKCVRLDGGTAISERQSIVERFNRRIGDESIFLLSSKAGGTGLNLIGANRLVLVDPDWNPANDAQVMSRIWREGQPKPVKIYRLLSTGSIEEKIYQRQIMKKDITSFVGDQSTYESSSSDNQKFSQRELKELLKLPSGSKCETFDLLRRLNTGLEDKWKDSSAMLDDPVLQKAVESGVTTFVSADFDSRQPPCSSSTSSSSNGSSHYLKSAVPD